MTLLNQENETVDSITSRVEVCDLCFDRLDQKLVRFHSLDLGSICFDRLDPSCLCFDSVRPSKNISIKFDRGKAYRPSSTEEKRFERVQLNTFFDREKMLHCVRSRKNVWTEEFFRPSDSEADEGMSSEVEFQIVVETFT